MIVSGHAQPILADPRLNSMHSQLSAYDEIFATQQDEAEHVSSYRAS